MISLGGNRIQNWDRLDDVLFAPGIQDQYRYGMIQAKDGQKIQIQGLQSYSVFVKSGSGKLQTDSGEALSPGDAIQICRQERTFTAIGAVEVLYVGVRQTRQEGLFSVITSKDQIKRVEKPWGYELWVTGEKADFVLKEIFIRKGTRTSLQFHRLKQETNVLFQGQAALHYQNGQEVVQQTLSPVTSIDVPPNTVHRLEALTDLLLYEASTPFLDDVVRIQDDSQRTDGRIQSEHQQATVCILTSGKGTRMGEAYSHINKALLPYQGKALLSHLIEKFPENTKVVIALGHHGNQVQDYLACAYPGRRFEFVQVDRFEGPGAGPAYSLLQCREKIQGPFFFLPCDTLWDAAIPMQSQTNWAGASQVKVQESENYCNLISKTVDSRNQVVRILDKEKSSDPQSYAFSGLLYVYDTEIFWEGLASCRMIAGEAQISNGLQALVQKSKLEVKVFEWKDFGNQKQYQDHLAKTENFDFSKSDEFIFFTQDRVIKYFRDLSVSRKRVEKAAMNPKVFPKIDAHNGNFYAYKKVPGETLYTLSSVASFSRLLPWLKENLWTQVSVDSSQYKKACHNFYPQKTLQRIDQYVRKYPAETARTEPWKVNRVTVSDPRNLLKNFDWTEMESGFPVLFHGDLQFDNVLWDAQAQRFTLIDWRQDFGGHVEMGDWYYDLAKLWGGICLNYDRIKKGEMSFQEKLTPFGIETEITYPSCAHPQELEKVLFQFIEQNSLDGRKVRRLTALIYLNMAALHHPPFDRLLWALGALELQKALK
ncbi:MAG: NTP transferase domain-containing protein [Bdellovibrionales bacterium]|nr:NTP transferase domain-containing protein [Bdellovibrionales bacterium]